MKKILLIEDDSQVVDTYKAILGVKDLHIDAIVDPREAMDEIKEHKPNLVLLDIMMPYIDGTELLEELKKDPQTKDIPVVMLTNLGMDEVIQKCMNLGASGYILKSSVNPDQLLKEVEMYL